MKAKILKMTGLTEAEFYKKYPTKEAFEMTFNNTKKFDLGGIVSGASSGASMGSSLGPWGALAGAVIGGAASQIKDVKEGNAELASYDKQINSSKLAYGGELPSYSKGGGIHINPANKGKFNALKKRTGKTTEELTHSKNPLTRKRAIFAQNAAKWKHAYGGDVGKNANTPPSMSFDRNMPTTASLQTVIQKYRPADAYAAGGIIPDYKVGGLLEHAIGSNFYPNGGMLKRADGSYSQRGLWDNIRANKGSGKAPTKEMLKQEAKIKTKYVDGGETREDSLSSAANKDIKFEVTMGAPGGAPAPVYADRQGDWLSIANKQTSYGSAANTAKVADWLWRAGWDWNKGEQTINPKAYILGEYKRKYKKYDSKDWDDRWGWSGRSTVSPEKIEKEYTETVAKLPDQEQQVLINLAQDWFYKNRYAENKYYGKDSEGKFIRDEYGAISPDYKAVWAPGIKNMYNVMEPFDKGKIQLSDKDKINYDEYYRRQTVPKQKASGGYLNGNNMTEYIGAGGTHEENPNEGVNIGDKGLVEEKEVKYNYKDETGDNSYIFSNRLGFAPKAKRIMKKFDVRDNDKLSVEAKKQRLDMLKDKQEVVRTKMGYKGKFDNQMPMAAFGGGLNKYYGGGEFGEDISNPYVAENAPLQPMEFTLQKENEINTPLNKTSNLPMKPLGAPQFPVNTPNPQMKDINGNFVRENAPTAMKSLSTPQIPTTDLPRARMKDANGKLVRDAALPPMKRLGIEIPLTPKTPAIPNKLKTVDPGKFTTIEGKSKPAPKKDFGTKLANFGQFAGSLAKFATSLQGGDPVNLERMQDARISSKPAEIAAANELNQIYNAANTDIRNQAGSNAGSYLASRIASASSQADKTGATMADIRSKYDQMNLQSGLTTGQFNALTQQKEEDLRTQERDRARTLGIEAAGQAGQTFGNIKKSENKQEVQDQMIGLIKSGKYEFGKNPETDKYMLQYINTLNEPRSFGGYIKGYGGFMYKSKKKK